MSFRTETDPLGSSRFPPTRTTVCRRCARSRTLPSAGCARRPTLVTATILVKKAAADANEALGRLEADVANAISRRRRRDLSGRLREQFVVDVYQAGAGTSHNMNANEVLANRAGEILGEPAAHLPARPSQRSREHGPVRPTTSTPTSTRLALLLGAAPLVASAHALGHSLALKADTFADVLKTGRTHLQDAVPITLGQEFSGYAECIHRGADDVARASEQLFELNIGATAVGTGLNAGDDFRLLVVQNLARYTALLLKPAANLFRVTQSMGDVLAYSGAMRRLAVEAGKIASDLRLLSMGPAGGTVGDCIAGGAAGLVDHAGQGESVGARDGQPGVLSGDRLRSDDRDRVRSRSARAQRDDAGHRLERAPRLDDSARSDEGVPPSLRRWDRRGPGARARTTRPQHGHGNSPQPAHRLRGHGGETRRRRSRPADRFASSSSNAS